MPNNNSNNPLELGIKAGTMLRRVLTVENQGMIIAHRMEGRRRYTCKRLKGDADLCAALQEAIAAFPKITSVKVSPVTGSITVTYTQEEKIIDGLFDSLSHQLGGHHAQQEQSILPSSFITISDSLNETARGMKDKVCAFLNHTEPLFASRLIGLALVSYGLSRIIMRGDRPAGPQLFWWGLGLLLRQTHRHFGNLAPKVQEPKKEDNQ